MLRNTVFALALAVAIVVAAPVFAAPATLKVPQGTDVPLRFEQAIDTLSAQQGAKVSFAVAADVLIDRKVVVKSEAKGEGIVMKVQGPSAFRAAKVTISFVKTVAVDGSPLLLQDVVVGGFSQVPGAHFKQAESTVVTSTTLKEVVVTLPSR